MLITDSQVHIWAPDTAARPWPDYGRSYAHGPAFCDEQLLRAMGEAGVGRAILVPPSFEGDRNDICLRAARLHPDRFAVMARIRLLDPDASQTLDWLMDQPGSLGLRLTFSRGMTALVTDPRLEWFWRTVEERAIPLMTAIAGQLGSLPDVLATHPGLRVIVDHLGVPVGVRDDDVAPVIDQLLGLAAFDNVAVKASGLPAMSTQPYPFANLHDHIYAVVDAFGAHRVFWGSDLTRMPCDYQQVVSMFTEQLDRLSARELESIMGRGITDWLGWPA